MITFRKTVLALAPLTIFTATQVSSFNVNNNNNDYRDNEADKAGRAPVKLNRDSDEFSSERETGSYNGNSFESDESSEKVEEVQITGATWEEMKPKLEALIEETIANPLYEERHFAMNFTKEEQIKYFEWCCEECCKSRYPIGIGGFNRSYEGPDPTINSTDVLIISNYTLEERRSQQSEAYEIYGMHNSSSNVNYNFLLADLEPATINERTFHNLMVRAKLTKEELNRGGYDSAIQSPVDVLPITLKNIELDKAVQELRAVIDSSLQNSMKPLVVTVFNLDPKAQFLVNQLHSEWSRIFTQSPRYCRVIRSTIIERDESRLYLVLNNDLQRVLDIHGLKPSEAKKRVWEFTCKKYESFQTHLHIMTGRGKHSDKGVSILKLKLPEWLEDDAVCHLIQSHKRNTKNPGLYDITLHPPITISSPELLSVPCHQMILMGSITALRPSLDGRSMLLHWGKEPEINKEDIIDVRIADEEKYLKPKYKIKKADPSHKAAAQPDAPKEAPKAPKQQANAKAPAKAAKKGPAQKAAAKKKGGKK